MDLTAATACLDIAQDERRAAMEARMTAVRRALSRETCILASRILWREDGAMLPLVLRRWEVHEDEIRQAVRRRTWDDGEGR